MKKLLLVIFILLAFPLNALEESLFILDNVQLGSFVFPTVSAVAAPPATPTASSNGNDAYVVLLLHGDGADGAQVFPDESAGSSPTHTMTVVLDTQVDTAIKQLGSGSILFDGVGDRLTAPDSADWYFGTGDFTIDYWIYYIYRGTFSATIEQREAGDVNSWTIFMNSNNCVFQNYPGSATISISNAWNPSDDTWYHFAVVRNGNNFYMFVDGTQIGSTQVDADPVNDYNALLTLGYVGGGANSYLYGQMDEIRISKGIARWTSNFTPPTANYSE